MRIRTLKLLSVCFTATLLGGNTLLAENPGHSVNKPMATFPGIVITQPSSAEIPLNGVMLDCGVDLVSVDGGSEVYLYIQGGSQPENLFWIPAQGFDARTYIGTVNPGETLTVRSTSGHAFILENEMGCSAQLIAGSDGNTFQLN